MTAPLNPCLHCEIMATIDRWLASDVSDDAYLRGIMNIAGNLGMVLADVMLRETNPERRLEALTLARAVMMSKMIAGLSKESPAVSPTHPTHEGRH